jgi:transposase, IS5 family
MKLERRDPQMTFVKYDLDTIVSQEHALRKIAGVVSFGKIAKKYVELKTTVGRHGYGLEVGIQCLFLQFYYDLSDRELEERLRYDIALRWFCGMGLDEQTPDHTFFCRVRKELGTKRVGQVFKNIRDKSERAGIVRKVFNFVDASAIRVKETTWAERDKALSAGEESLNNENVQKYSADKDARFGCKGKEKFWYGYKRHVSVDMGSGLIEKVAVTSANLPDHKGLKHICPDERMVFGDKGYCVREAQGTLQAHGCHAGVIKKRNMRDKNPDKDRWLSRVRGPYESVFSQQEKRARYRGLAKVQMQAFLEAMVFNVKRLVNLHAPPLYVGA